MTIIETIKSIIDGEDAEQKMRTDSLKFKDTEIEKHKQIIINIQNEKIRIQKEIDQSGVQIQALIGVKDQLEEAICVGEQELQK